MGASAAILMAGTTLSSSYSQAESARAQGDFQKELGDINAGLADSAANEAINKGNFEANRAMQKGRQAAAAARVSAAASGLDPNSGSAADVVDASQQAALADSLMIKNNAAREAWGYKVEAINSRTKGEFARLSGRNEANNTLLTGVLKASAYGAEAYGISKRGAEKPSPTSGADQTNIRSQPSWFFGTNPRPYAQPVQSDKYSDWWRK